MVGVSTIALIERKPDISRDLFTRYWRDVHGVMAARIPGFESYTQYHVTPVSTTAEPFEGIAIVTFAGEADRQGLATSEITKHIHRDEQNVFRRALLYNLDGAACRSTGDGDRQAKAARFFVLPAGIEQAPLVDAIADATWCDRYDLTSGDPAGWNDTDIDGCRFVTLVHAGWADDAAVDASVAQLADMIPAYRLDDAHVMVEGGFPTPVGLRGLDAVRTINEAGADNQLAADVVRAIYGAALAG